LPATGLWMLATPAFHPLPMWANSLPSEEWGTYSPPTRHHETSSHASLGQCAPIPNHDHRATRDLLKLAVVERHRGTGNIGLGLVTGFGLRAGAFASSVAHDSHNLIAVGADDRDLLCARSEVSRLGGGLAVCARGRVLSAMALPIAGLMTHAPLAQVTGAFQALHQSVQTLGCALARPFMALSFLAIPVIPELRLTDRGLVNIERACFVPLHAA
jgi:adenine deaminase